MRNTLNLCSQTSILRVLVSRPNFEGLYSHRILLWNSCGSRKNFFVFGNTFFAGRITKSQKCCLANVIALEFVMWCSIIENAGAVHETTAEHFNTASQGVHHFGSCWKNVLPQCLSTIPVLHQSKITFVFICWILSDICWVDKSNTDFKCMAFLKTNRPLSLKMPLLIFDDPHSREYFFLRL